ncbi:MAG: CDP-diacylglycerol--serine O-phosphatidyltransferase [bacterium]
MNKEFFHRHLNSRKNSEGKRTRRFRVRRFNKNRKDIKLVHLLPNVLTSFNVAAGVSSIIMAVNGRYEFAAILILVAVFFDMIDGKVARFVGSNSPFGVQLDSLADVISFGIAPPMLLYSLMFHDFDRIGLSMVLVYTLSTALRLARYNVQADVVQSTKRDSFVGLPCPVPATFIASGVLLCLDYSLTSTAGKLVEPVTLNLVGYHLPVDSTWFRTMIHVIMVGLSILMVSTVPYPDLASRYIERKHVFEHNVIMVMVLGVVLLIAKVSIFVLATTFIVMGVLQATREFFYAPLEESAEAPEHPDPVSTRPEPVSKESHET